MRSEFDHVLNRAIFLALWKIHILRHAAEGEVAGQTDSPIFNPPRSPGSAAIPTGR